MNLQACEICQEISKVSTLTKEFIYAVIEKHQSAIKNYAFILHDKDLKEDGQIKASHWHIMLQFKYPQDTKNIANWFGVKEQYINRIKTRFKTALCYLIHFGKPEKYQYPVNEVMASFDYGLFITKLEHKEVTYDFDNNPLGYYREMFKDSAKKLRDVKYCYENYLVLKNEKRIDREMKVIYISGQSGIGKTTLAKSFAKTRYATSEIFVSGSSNDFLDGYEGQKCIILDDLREDAICYSDLLKFLDNNTNSKVKSRFTNKQLCRCELVIITSVKCPKQLYLDTMEDKTQLYRRITEWLDINKDKQDHLICCDYIYDLSLGSYEPNSCVDVTQMVSDYIKQYSKQISNSFVDTLLKQGKVKSVISKDKDLPF